VEEGFACVMILFYVWHCLNIFLFGTAAFTLLCKELVAVAMAFLLAFAATGVSVACGDVTE